MAKFKAYFWPIVLALVALFFLFMTMVSVWQGDLQASWSTFGMAVLSVCLARLSQFKKFKGWGFEAELWDQQAQEAAQIIKSFKSLADIHSETIIDSQIMNGRFGVGSNWRERFALFERLSAEHEALGYNSDFGKQKAKLDAWFIFDATRDASNDISSQIDYAKQRALREVSDNQPEGVPVPTETRDRIDAIPRGLENEHLIARDQNLATEILSFSKRASDQLEALAGVCPEYGESHLAKLRRIEALRNAGPLVVNETLFQLLPRRD